MTFQQSLESERALSHSDTIAFYNGNVMTPHRIGLIGFGKIAQDQHFLALAHSQAFELVAVADPRAPLTVATAKVYDDYGLLLADETITAVAICTPPAVRHVVAQRALLAGKDVLLEKPPSATLSELDDLKTIADRQGRVLFTTWHSQYNPAVVAAKSYLFDKKIKNLTVTWKEDVRHWHPNQAWIWQAGGFGVFDPGINALSIVTKIMPEALFVRSARLEVPRNCHAPIGAEITFGASRAGGDSRAGQTLTAVFDWRQTGLQTWDIDITTEADDTLRLSLGGSCLAINGREIVHEPPAEYPAIYRHFDDLLRQRHSHVDDAPLRLVADCFMVGQHVSVEPFMD